MYYPNHQPYHNLPLLLDENECKNPRKVIPAFFDCYGYPCTMHYLQLWFNTAIAHRRFNHRTVLEMLSLKSELLKLLEAASIFTDNGRSNIPAKETDLFQPRWFYDYIEPGHTAWDYFPRHLSEEQYRRPALVLEECRTKRTLPEWRSILDVLFFSACHRSANNENYSGSIYQVTYENNIGQRCRQLLQLVEAAHLIDVRERTALTIHITAPDKTRVLPKAKKKARA